MNLSEVKCKVICNAQFQLIAVGCANDIEDLDVSAATCRNFHAHFQVTASGRGREIGVGFVKREK